VSGYDDLEIDGVSFQNLSVGAINGTFEGTNVVVTNCDEMEDLPFTPFTAYTYLNDYFNELVYRGVKLPNSTVRTAMDDFFDNMGTTLRGAVVESHFAFGGGRDQCLWNTLNPSTKLVVPNVDATARFAHDPAFGVKTTAGTTSLALATLTDDIAIANISFASYVSESSVDTTANRFLYGARILSASSSHLQLQPKISTDGNRRRGTGSDLAFANANHKGSYVQSYDGTNDNVWKDNTKDQNTVTPSTPTISTKLLWLARNNSASGGGISQLGIYPQYCSFLMIFNTQIDDTLFSTYKAALDTFISEAGIP
jgi:hypothetical protein